MLVWFVVKLLVVGGSPLGSTRAGYITAVVRGATTHLGGPLAAGGGVVVEPVPVVGKARAGVQGEPRVTSHI